MFEWLIKLVERLRNGDRREFLATVGEAAAGGVMPDIPVKMAASQAVDKAESLLDEFTSLVEDKYFPRHFACRKLLFLFTEGTDSVKRTSHENRDKFIYRNGPVKYESQAELSKAEPIFGIILQQQGPDKLFAELENKREAYQAVLNRMAYILENGNLEKLKDNMALNLGLSVILKNRDGVITSILSKESMRERAAELRKGDGYDDALNIARDYAQFFHAGRLDDFLDKYWDRYEKSDIIFYETKTSMRNKLLANAGPNYKPCAEETASIGAKNLLEHNLHKFNIRSTLAYDHKTGIGPAPSAARIWLEVKEPGIPDSKVMENIATKLQKAYPETVNINSDGKRIMIEDPDMRFQKYLHALIETENNMYFTRKNIEEINNSSRRTR